MWGLVSGWGERQEGGLRPHELYWSLVIYDGRVGLCSDLILPSPLHHTTHNVKQEQRLDDIQLNISISSIFTIQSAWKKVSSVQYF